MTASATTITDQKCENIELPILPLLQRLKDALENEQFSMTLNDTGITEELMNDIEALRKATNDDDFTAAIQHPPYNSYYHIKCLKIFIEMVVGKKIKWELISDKEIKMSEIPLCKIELLKDKLIDLKSDSPIYNALRFPAKHQVIQVIRKDGNQEIEISLEIEIIKTIVTAKNYIEFSNHIKKLCPKNISFDQNVVTMTFQISRLGMVVEKLNAAIADLQSEAVSATANTSTATTSPSTETTSTAATFTSLTSSSSSNHATSNRPAQIPPPVLSDNPKPKSLSGPPSISTLSSITTFTGTTVPTSISTQPKPPLKRSHSTAFSKK